MIREWLNEIINGVGGLLDYERYEIAPHSDMHTAEWVIKCLANPKCAGSQQVLDAVIQRRISQLPEVEAINRDNQVTITVGDFEDRYVSRASFDDMQERLQKRIAELEAGQQWVSVEERMPGRPGWYTVYVPTWEGYGNLAMVDTAYYRNGGWEGGATAAIDDGAPVSHWCELQPPGGEE